MPLPSHQELIDRYIAAYNAFDVAGMLAVLAPDIRFENYSGSELTASASGIDAFRQLAEKSASLFSEREQRVTAIDLGQGWATAEIAYRGRLVADIPDGPRAGAVIELKGRSDFMFHEGRIVKIVDRS